MMWCVTSKRASGGWCQPGRRSRARGLKLNTIQKAMREGRIHTPNEKKLSGDVGHLSNTQSEDGASACAGSVDETSVTRQQPAASTKSQRAEVDCAAPMGRGATATMERLAASLGKLDEAARVPALDIPKGGVLLALPALLLCGLLRHSSKYFRLPAGFYGLKTIFLLLAFMALGRLKSVEALRYYAPGRSGQLLGLGALPEVRTLRIKLKHLADQEQAFAWSSTLCRSGCWKRRRKLPFSTSTVMSQPFYHQHRQRHCPSIMWLASACA